MANQFALRLIRMPARTNRASGSVERHEYPVTRCFDQVPPVFFDNPLCGPIMLIEQTTP